MARSLGHFSYFNIHFLLCFPVVFELELRLAGKNLNALIWDKFSPSLLHKGCCWKNFKLCFIPWKFFEFIQFQPEFGLKLPLPVSIPTPVVLETYNDPHPSHFGQAILQPRKLPKIHQMSFSSQYEEPLEDIKACIPVLSFLRRNSLTPLLCDPPDAVFMHFVQLYFLGSLTRTVSYWIFR